MAEPSLSEITSIRGDAGIGQAESGGNATVIAPNTQGLNFLQAAAQTRNAANKYIYDRHQDNLKQALEKFNTTDVKGLFEPDYGPITDKWRDLTQEIYQNFDVLSNPMKNPQLYADLMAKQRALDGEIAQSKQHSVLYGENQKLLQAHPEWNTPENIRAQRAFTVTPLEQRQIINLNPPKVYNPMAIIKAADEYSQQSVASSKVKNGYIVKTETEQNDPELYMNGVKAYLNSSNGYGGTFGDAIKDQLKDYNRVNPSAPLNYDQFVEKTFRPYVPKAFVKKSDISADPYALEGVRFAHDKAMQAIRSADDKDKWVFEQKYKEANNTEKGDFVNLEVANMFRDLGKPGSPAQKIKDPFTNTTVTEQVLTLSPNTKKLFSVVLPPTEGMTKGAIRTPDYFTYTKDGGIRAVFRQKDSQGKDITTGPQGEERAIDTELTQIYTPDQVRSVVATHVAPGQFDDVMTSANRELKRRTGSDYMDKSTVDKYLSSRNSSDPSGQTKSGSTKVSVSTSKTVPASTIKSLVGKQGYEGYTEKELTDYYKSQGYTIR